MPIIQSKAQVYVLDCGDSLYYVGWTTHLHLRLVQHFNGGGCQFTKRNKPRALLYYGPGNEKEELRIWKIFARLFQPENVGGYPDSALTTK